jgi:predicted SAM-dependent methyltransferase
MKLNVGCGQSPTPGWKNYDNSWCVRLARVPFAARLLARTSALDDSQKEFIRVVKRSSIQWADAAKRIPEDDATVRVLYSSHMIEHLDRGQANRFLKEGRRVLVSGGIIRLAVPNIRYHVERYLQDHDADRLVDATGLIHPRPKSLVEKLKYLVVGDRHHKWMYDGDSLCQLLSSAGFCHASVVQPGTTTIADPGQLNLREREPESVFVEAVNP